MKFLLAILFFPVTVLGFFFREAQRSFLAGIEINDISYEVEK